jgi:hypothetical protein
MWVASGLLLAVAGAGAGFAFWPGDDLGCLGGLVKVSDVTPTAQIVSVVPSSSSPPRMYVSTGDARLFVGGEGARWRRVTDRLPATVTTSVGKRDVLYAGGTAVFRSSDRGRSWDQLSCGLLVSDIAISPRDPQTIYAGASSGVDANKDTGGLYRTTDGGKSWKRFKRFAKMDPYQPSVNALAVDPRDPRALYIGLEFGGVQISADGGEHWSFSRIHGEDPGLFGPQLTSLAFAPDRPRALWASSRLQGVFRGDAHATAWTPRGLRGTWVHAVVPDQQLPDVVFAVLSEGVVRSGDGGAHWRRIKTLPDHTRGLVVQPLDDTIFAWSGHAIFRSRDHGVTWIRLPPLPL